MKKTFAAGLLVALAAAGTALAQEATPRAPRVAVIDMARVSAESLLGKGYAAQLEKRAPQPARNRLCHEVANPT